MKKIVILLALPLCSPAFAETAQPLEPMTVAPVTAEVAAQHVLPANTEVTLRMNDTLTSKGNTFHEGDDFGLTVSQNVFLDGYVVIPQGARATGRITWLTSKGAFGKSGKMEIGLQYVEVNGRRIPLEGTYRQEGEGNTVATIGGVIAVGVFAGFVTGKSAVIPQGRELTARTKQDLPVRIAAGPAPLPREAWTAASREDGRAVTVAAPAVRPSGRAAANWGLVPVSH